MHNFNYIYLLLLLKKHNSYRLKHISYNFKHGAQVMYRVLKTYSSPSSI